MTLRRTLKYDLFRCMKKKSYIIKIFLISIICLISQVDFLRELFQGKSLSGYDVVGIYNFILHYDRFKLLIIITISSIYVQSYCEDLHSGVIRYVLIRGRKATYVVSKCITIVISGIIAYVTAILLYVLMLMVKIPLAETKEAFFGEANFFSFAGPFPKKNPIMWLSVTSLLFIMSILSITALCFYLSFYIRDAFIVICLPAVVYFCLTSLTSFLPAFLFLPAYGNSIELIQGNAWANYIFKMMIDILLIMLFMMLSVRKLRRLCDEGKI